MDNRVIDRCQQAYHYLPVLNENKSFPGRYWHCLADGRIQCDVCPRFCKLGDHQKGFCFVRERAGDQIVLTTYGRSSGFCIDPVEKKPLFHFLPGSPILSFGTAGCNLGCRFCQNWEISKSKEVDTLAYDASPLAIAQTALHYGCPSVAFTYNDPVIFLEYAVDVAKECHKLGIKAVAVTAGEINAGAREEFFEYMDAANVDLKGFTEDFYKRLCIGQLKPVLETLEYIKHKTKTWLEITTLLIPGENDSKNEIDAMTKWIYDHLGTDVPLHFSAYHPDFRLNKLPTPPETLFMAYEIAQKNGLKYVYTGNTHHPETETTFCAHCHKALIKRDWYELSDYHLKDGACVYCHTPLEGVFTEHQGDWGSKRMAVVPLEWGD